MPLTGPALGALRILLIEDSPEDAELMCEQMLDAGLEASFERVESAQELREALERAAPDIVLSDLSMPGFSGNEALQIVRAALPEVPFIFVSGTMGEENAVAALHQGANDYIIKHQPARLPSAVARAVREARSAIDRQRVEAELMRAQRLESLSLLAAGLSHDLRNILQPLLIMPDLMKARTEDPQLHHLADIIAECGRRGHEMAESMLSFVRGSRKPSEHICLVHLFEGVELLLRSNLPAKVTLHLEVADGLAVDANYTELQQVLLNLSLNAIQAMPNGGRLTLRAAPAADTHGDDWLRISVTDEGIGMDADTLSHLFNPFFTTKATGTGLGLISCKRIIEGAHGSIHVDSQPGVGTRFDLLLPMREITDTADAVDGPIAAGAGQSILVVDGEATRLSLLGNALSSQGYHLQLASDGAAALRWMQQESMPALVIADAGSKLLSASHLLGEMATLGYRGPALVLEEADVTVPLAVFPPGINVHVLRKPLEMQQVFRSVAEALETA
ncbi:MULTISPECIES: ATP-binding protein [Stenotrophomonas]|jgi:signal transduction histidine kinase|uniref:histidine kinase n=1 Tax=Stenotrophomonas bentonitica TaxID=1450134 RepID=A0ABU9JTE8_9GAMM|nr:MULTISPECIES: ATP-binding protein [Stenotrophomonas]AOX61923.1 hybrid sensor histidine kinase/response regulator [Stenotrophomonas sp. LM091]MCX2919045.1 response regulator [Stenotrophomonas rhizophila]MDX5517695.1 response regulator [Stenotrophomonas sp. RG-453]OFS93697.1 hybrid sensor histidine kinase/response regulator [Stenotrophomonas sp. HMSC10F06]